MEGEIQGTMNGRKEQECHLLPHFPGHKEKVKILFDGVQKNRVQKNETQGKVFALKNISLDEVAVELLASEEPLPLSKGERCKAEVQLMDQVYPLDLEVLSVQEDSAHFRIFDLEEEVKDAVLQVLDPRYIARSLQEISIDLVPENFGEGITQWFHGNINSDLYIWKMNSGTWLRVVLAWNGCFWEWSEAKGVRTGNLDRDAKGRGRMAYHSKPLHRIQHQTRKILENMEALDYRLVEFLLGHL